MKKILLAALFAPLVAFAQTYPSPTFQNTTVLGTLTSATSTISGGSINGATVGATTPSTGAFTTLSTTGLATLNGLSVTNAPTFSTPLPIASGGTGQATTSAAAHAFGLGTTDTPTFYGITLNGSTAHGLVVGGGNGNPATYTAAGTAGNVLASNGASSDPTFQQLTASMVNYTAPITGAATRTQQAKNADVVSVMDTGADPTCTTDSAPAFRQAMADVAYGGEIDIPKGCYLLNSATNNAILDFTPFPNKGINWKGQGWTLKTGGSFSFGSGTGPSGSILVIGSAISNTTDFYHQAPTDLVIGGVSFRDFAIVASTGAYGTPHGQNGFNFDGTANANGYIENMLMDNLFIDNFASGSSILVNAGTTNLQGVLAGADIRNSKFMNFRGIALGDSDTIEDNIIGANAGTTGAVGINFYNVSGATNTRILNNDMVNFNGMILVGGCTKCIIDGNEFEQSTGSSNALGAMISLSGANGVIDTPTITNNSISQNSAVANYTPLNVSNANGARISSNRFSTLSAYSDVIINSNSSYSVVSADNQSWVNGVAQSSVAVQDSGTKSMLLGQPWTAFSPTVTASSGTFGSVSAFGRYKLTGNKTMHVEYDITITTVGTASGTVNVSLPSGFTAAAYESIAGKEVATTGDGLASYISTGSGTFLISNSAGSSIIGASNHLILTGTIEVQ